jgi:hypothetical protein
VHGHGTEELPPPSGEASVVLDVGGPYGALVVLAPERLEGTEIEIHRVDRPWDGTHTAVRRRDLRDTVAYAGVFGRLLAGRYELRIVGGDPDPAAHPALVRVTVTGGEVTQAAWPEHPDRHRHRRAPQPSAGMSGPTVPPADTTASRSR